MKHRHSVFDWSSYWVNGSDRKIRIGNQVRYFPYSPIRDPEFESKAALWKRSCGLIWCLKRFKLLKTIALHIIAGDKQAVHDVVWMKTTSYRGFGIPNMQLFRRIVDAVLTSQVKTIRLLLSVLNSYKLYRLVPPDASSITDPGPKFRREQFDMFIRTLEPLPKFRDAELFKTEVALNTCTSHYLSWEDKVQRGPMLETSARYITDESMSEYVTQYGRVVSTPKYQGKLCAIPDKGKARIICIADKDLQLRTYNLAKTLRNWSWSMPENVSSDQRKADVWIEEGFIRGSVFLALDLKNATDRFPLSFQLRLLERLDKRLLSVYYPLFSLPVVGLTNNVINYAAGQPMGAYYSFPLFEICHTAVCRCCFTDFIICGDDVLARFTSREDANAAYQRYVEYMHHLGVHISKEKTLISQDLAEGVGRLVWKGHHIEPMTGQLSRRETQVDNESLFTKATKEDSNFGRALFAMLNLKSLRVAGVTYQSRRRLSLDLVSIDLHQSSESGLRTLLRKRRIEGLPEEPKEAFTLLELLKKAPVMSPLNSIKGRIRPLSKKGFELLLIANSIIRLMVKEIDDSRWVPIDEPYTKRHLYSPISDLKVYYDPQTSRLLRYINRKTFEYHLL